METSDTDSFKVLKSAWMPVIGHAYAIVGLNFHTPAYRFVERYVFFRDGSGLNAVQIRYNDVDEDIFGNAEIFEQQTACLDAFVRSHIMQNKDAFSEPSDYYRALAGGKWTEESNAELFYVSLRSPESNLRAVLTRIRNNTRCNTLYSYLRDILRVSRSSSIEEIKVDLLPISSQHG